MLTGKKILLAVSGSIAAYKTAFFVRLLVKSGAEVRVIMTPSAKEFISPLTLATLSKHPVYSDYFESSTGVWTNHVELGMWADLMVIAPLTANTLAKIANGYCDNLLCATYLSAKCPVMLAPAMDLDMYQHPSTVDNLKKVASFGNIIIAAEEGELASGLYGTGRMAEPEHLIEHVVAHFSNEALLKDKQVLITSGPTYESIDPVRFIGNHSSGKMGAALANACISAGARVTFVTGPVKYLPSPSDNLNIVKVSSALEMLNASKSSFDQTDVAIFAAAVADFRPKESSPDKIKRKGQSINIELIPNPDIAAELGAIKKQQFTVGFALETNDEATNAQAKLTKKNFDMIVLNSLNDKGAGFSHDTNKVSIFDKDNNSWDFGLKSKTEVAKDIVNLIAKKIN
jgi:phosphopantothenoylcysteine decarboxylase/phosphopantothenate--cysteine ligase